MSLSQDQIEQESLLKLYKNNAIAVIAILFGIASFVDFNTIFAPLGLVLGVASYYLHQAAWSVPAIMVCGFATLFMLMQTFSGGYLLTH
jgi:hypothetical protein